METNILISVYAAVLLISTCFAGLLWFAYRHDLLKLIFLFWLTGIAAFLCQGCFAGSDLQVFLSFTTNAFSLFVLMRIYSQACDLRVPWKVFSALILAGLVTSVALLSLGVNFTAGTAPFSLLFGSVMIYGALFLKGEKSRTLLARGFRFLIFLNGLHFFDFPFLRPRADMAVLGFSIALIFFFCYAVYIPIFIMKSISDGYTEKLEKQVAERTRDLSIANETLSQLNTRLSSQNAVLKELGEQNSSLLNVVVHDISSPLTVLCFETQKLEQEALSEKQSRSTARIQKALASIFDIVQHTKTMHAQRLGKSRASIKGRANLRTVFESLLADYSERLSEKQLKVELSIDPDANVTGDGERLKHQVFGNLLSNAIKFSHVGGTIEFTASKSGQNVVVSVRDHGVGIPPERQSTIFSSHEPTSTVGTNGEAGTGLGLPIVREYAGLMGGSVRIQNPTGASDGTCFEVTLQAAA